MPVQPGPLLSSLSLQSGNGFKEQFDVIEDDIPIWQECIKSQHSRMDALQAQQKDDIGSVKDRRPHSDKDFIT